MRLSFPTHRLAATAAIAGGAIGLLAAPGSAGATVPGTDGTIVTAKCEEAVNCTVGHLWTVDPVTGSERALTNDPANFDDDPSVSPDGTRVAYRRCNDSNGTACTIAVIGINGGTSTDLSAGTHDDYPAFSPDGTKIAFMRDDGAGNSHLVLMDANGTNQQPLTSGNVLDEAPAWSPDGSSIAFDRWVSGPGTRIYKVVLGGGSPAPLTSGPGDYGPTFSPDGSHIAFQNSSKIQLMDSTGANQHTLTDVGPSYLAILPVFSPDGTQIAFARYSTLAPNPTPLMVMNADGSSPHPISSTSEVFYRPDWQSTHPAPAAAPPAAQVAAPTLTLGAPKKESVHRGRVYVFATSNRAVAGAAGGRVSAPQLAKSYRLGRSSKALAANTRTKVVLRIPNKALRATRAALARHEKVNATLVVQVKDKSGNTTTKRVKLRLTK